MYVNHILDAMTDIYSYVRDSSEKDFFLDKKTQDAVIRKLEIIGEASNHFTHAVQNLVPRIPWRDIVDMRNKLTHDYFDVDLAIIWGTVKNDFPQFEAAMKELREALTSGSK